MIDQHIPEFVIDKDGRWFTDGVLMVQKKIITLFAEHMQKDEQGKYAIKWQGINYPVQVEDVPFWVDKLEQEGDALTLHLYDGRKVPMPDGPIWMKNDAPYLSVFWERDTKLSQHVFSILSSSLIERDGAYFIRYAGREWSVKEV